MNHEARSTDDIDHGNNLLHGCSSLALSLLKESKIKLREWGDNKEKGMRRDECGGNVVGDIEPAAAAPLERDATNDHIIHRLLRRFLFWVLSGFV